MLTREETGRFESPPGGGRCVLVLQIPVDGDASAVAVFEVVVLGVHDAFGSVGVWIGNVVSRGLRFSFIEVGNGHIALRRLGVRTTALKFSRIYRLTLCSVLLRCGQRKRGKGAGVD